uniref:Uncharacterized protein n=1 Tax=Oryza meridionalis TaxID=40149 RepID=A0A0E0D2Y9_9ORYZ
MKSPFPLSPLSSRPLPLFPSRWRLSSSPGVLLFPGQRFSSPSSAGAPRRCLSSPLPRPTPLLPFPGRHPQAAPLLPIASPHSPHRRRRCPWSGLARRARIKPSAAGELPAARIEADLIGGRGLRRLGAADEQAEAGLPIPYAGFSFPSRSPPPSPPSPTTTSRWAAFRSRSTIQVAGAIGVAIRGIHVDWWRRTVSRDVVDETASCEVEMRQW